MQKEEFANLIKKDQVMLQRNRDKLQNIYEGVMGLKKMPDALFIIGVNKERTAIREARKMGIPIIGLCNTSSNPKLVDYVIPGNDEGKKSIEFFSKFVAETIKGPEQNEETLVADNNGEGETEVTTAS
jgi:small subunit ribosomal protein S2